MCWRRLSAWKETCIFFLKSWVFVFFCSLLASPTYAELPFTGNSNPDLFSGAFNYSIPIETPAGRAGLQPNLSLSYSSSKGNGPLGVGWGLEVGSIQRSTKDGLDYSGDDYVFAAGTSSGILVKLSDGTYRAEIEGGFILFEKNGDSWTATFPDGRTFYFGQTAATRMDNPADANQIIKWSLDKVTDVHTNYMTYTYNKEGNLLTLQQIDFNGNEANSIAPNHQVRFYYETRQDESRAYLKGISVATDKRLKAIEVIANGNAYKTYVMEYDANQTETGQQYSKTTKRSLLGSIKSFGADAVVDQTTGDINNLGSTLAPFSNTFDYLSSGAQTDGFAYPFHALGQYGPSGATYNPGFQYTGDYNGDGRQDYMYYRNDGWYVALSKGDTGFHSPTKWLDGDGPGGYTWNSPAFQYVADLNGDGCSDYMYYRNGWFVALSNGKDGFAYPEMWLGPVGPTGNTWNAGFQYLGDFNGDKKVDYMYYRNGWHVALSNGVDGFEYPTLWLGGDGPTGYTWTIEAYQYVGDFNGDGSTDYMYYQDGWYVALSDQNGSFHYPELWLPTDGPSGETVNAQFQYLGDYNGDGNMDYMYYRDGWYVALSNGKDGFLTPEGWLMGNGPTGATWNSPDFQYAADFNGDGSTDYMYFRNGWYVATSNGHNGFNYPTLWLGGTGPTGDTWAVDLQYVGDFTGDGAVDYMYQRSGWHLATSHSKLDLISKITNSYGGSTSILYKSAAEYENTQLPMPRQTVNRITLDDGAGNLTSTDYEYAGGYYHLYERDFRGFNHVKVLGQISAEGKRRVKETWYHQGADTQVDVNDPSVEDAYMKGKPYRTRLSDQDGLVYEETTTEYHPDSDGVAPYFAPVSSARGQQFDGGGPVKRESRVDYIYDEYGNILQELNYGDIAIATDDFTVERTYTKNLTDRLLRQPASEKIFEGIGTAGDSLTEKLYYYDTLPDTCGEAPTSPTQGLLVQECLLEKGAVDPENPGTTVPARWISMRTGYNTLGTPAWAEDARGHRTTITFDPTGVYELTSRNVLGHQVSSDFYGVNGVLADNGLYGQVKTKTEINGGTSSTTYDAFGRKLRIEKSDGYWVAWEYNDGPGMYTRNSDAEGTSGYVFFDGLGRTIRKQALGPEGRTVLVDTEYDERGLVSRASLPYFSGETAFWVQTVHDSFGRPIQTTLPDSTQSRAEYFVGLTVKINNLGLAKKEYTDLRERLVKVEELKGVWPDTTSYATTTFEYDVKGNLIAVVDARGNRSENYFDSLGRKVKNTEPNTGVWYYAYDAQGKLIRQLDVKNQLCEITYDEIGRPISKKVFQLSNGTRSLIPGSEISYIYDIGPNTIGKLQKIISDGATKEYLYGDPLGRTTGVTTIIDGEANTITTTTDGRGRPQAILYPDGELVGYVYDAEALTQVSNNQGVVYAQFSNFNAKNQPQTVTYGNGVSTDYNYRADNGLLQNLTTATATETFQSLDYQFDSRGNLLQINDFVDGSRSQTFQYDTFNRLTLASSAAYGILSYAYDEIGNFTLKEGVAYSHSGPGPHAVTATTIDLATYTVNQDGSISYASGVLPPTAPEPPGSNGGTGGSQPPVDPPVDNDPDFLFMDIDGVLTPIPVKETVEPVSQEASPKFVLIDVGGILTPIKLEDVEGGGTTEPPGEELPWAESEFRITSVDGVAASLHNRSYQYDANGNLLSDGVRTFTYDENNRPISILNSLDETRFVYDGDGARVKKILSDGTIKVYVGGLYEYTQGGGAAKFIFANGQRIALKRDTQGLENTLYYHGDHLGSSTVITNSVGDEVERTFYKPFGETVSDVGSVNVNHKFTGQEFDSETGLYFYNARYYDPVLGKFTSPDTIIPEPTDPQSYNRYSYCINNPINYTDPSGHYFQAAIAAIGKFISSLSAASIAKGAAWGAAIGAATSAVTGGNVLQGAIYGALSGAAFGAVGGYIDAVNSLHALNAFEGLSSAAGYIGQVGRAVLHATAGMAASGIGGVITGEIDALSILLAGVGAGFAKYIGDGGYLGDMDASFSAYTKRSLVGGVISGGLAEVAGGEFWESFKTSAVMAGLAYLCNDLNNLSGMYRGVKSMHAQSLAYDPGVTFNKSVPLQNKYLAFFKVMVRFNISLERFAVEFHAGLAELYSAIPAFNHFQADLFVGVSSYHHSRMADYAHQQARFWHNHLKTLPKSVPLRELWVGY